MTSCSTSYIRPGTPRPDTAISLPCGPGCYTPELYLRADINASLFSDFSNPPSLHLSLSSSMTLQIYGYPILCYFITAASTLQHLITSQIPGSSSDLMHSHYGSCSSCPSRACSTFANKSIFNIYAKSWSWGFNS